MKTASRCVVVQYRFAGVGARSRAARMKLFDAIFTHRFSGAGSAVGAMCVCVCLYVPG